MSTTATFGDAVAAFYEEYMVPLVFEPYAEDLVARLSAQPLGDVLETAAGTGIVTRKLAALRVNAPRSIVATDLSQSMLDQARRICPDPAVRWQQADALSLPFPDASFDHVICEFGAMFFPDRPRAYGEARRVLRPGGRFVFSVWGSVQTNDFAQIAEAAVGALFPSDPPTFISRTPHGYHDFATITADLSKAGFAGPPSFDEVVRPSRAPSAENAARAFVRGTPLRQEIEERDASKLDAAVTAAEQALRRRFGDGPIEGKMQAFVVAIQR